MDITLLPIDFVDRVRTKQQVLDNEHRAYCQQMAALSVEIAQVTQRITNLPTAMADAAAVLDEQRTRVHALQEQLRKQQDMLKEIQANDADVETKRRHQRELLTELFGDKVSPDCLDVQGARFSIRQQETEKEISKLNFEIDDTFKTIARMESTLTAGHFADLKIAAEGELQKHMEARSRLDQQRMDTLDRLIACQRLADDYHERKRLEGIVSRHGFDQAQSWTTGDLIRKCQSLEKPCLVADDVVDPLEESSSMCESQCTSGYNSVDSEDAPPSPCVDVKGNNIKPLRARAPTIADNGWVNRKW